MAPLITTVNTVLPLFFQISLGYFFRRRGILSQDACDRVNTVAFDILIPCMVFYNIYSADLSALANPRLMLFAFVTTTVVFLLLLLVVPRFVNDPAKIGVVIQGSFRGSFVVLGMGLAATMFPGQDLGLVAIVSTVVAPMYNMYAVIALEMFSPKKSGIGTMIKSIITNPMIIATAAALLLAAVNLSLPTVMETTIRSLGNTATTVSLIVLGGTLNFSGLRDDMRLLVFACLTKLVVLPLVFIPIAIFMGFRDMELLVVLLLFGAPTAVSSHAMAVQADGDGQLAGRIVVLSTCSSAVSLFGFIYVLVSLGYF